MKTPTSHNKKRLIITSSIVGVVLIFGGVGAAIYMNNSNGEQPAAESTTDTIDNNPPTDEQLEAAEEIKKEAAEKNESIDESPIQDEESGEVGVIITAAEQSSGQLMVRSLIQTVSNDGTCTLTLRKTDGTTVTKTAGVQASASSSTCKGFDVPLSELSPGEWRITVSYKSDTLEGAAGHTVTIN